MPNCDFNFIEITLRHGCSPVNLLHIHGILSPHENWGKGRGVHSSGPVGKGGGRVGVPFHMNSGGTPSYGGSHN